MSKSSEINPAKAFEHSIVLSSAGIVLAILVRVFLDVALGIIYVAGDGLVDVEVVTRIIHWLILGISVILLAFSYSKFSHGLAVSKGRRSEFNGLVLVGGLFMAILLITILVALAMSIATLGYSG